MTPSEIEDISERLREAPTAAITGHLFKKHGMRMRWIQGVRPLDAGNCRFAGPAYTLRYVPQREDLWASTDLGASDSKVLRVMEEIPAGAVLVLDMYRETSVGALGDVLVSQLICRGVAGIVADGGMRDVRQISQLGLPVHCSGPASPPSPAGLMPVDVQGIVGCGGVAVVPGDFVVADEDGVVVIPAELAADVAEGALQKEAQDAWIQKQVAAGCGVRGYYPPSDDTLARYRRETGGD
ncbi:MAG: ribonuclease activity regulator RraA [Rhizobiales bacterium]|nr:ribonuclease activity regulator RraA [Hyphomicrobiales bacterium]